MLHIEGNQQWGTKMTEERLMLEIYKNFVLCPTIRMVFVATLYPLPVPQVP